MLLKVITPPGARTAQITAKQAVIIVMEVTNTTTIPIAASRQKALIA